MATARLYGERMAYVPGSSVQSSTSARCVAHRVDALVLAYQIVVAEPLWTALEGFRVQAETERHAVKCDLGRLAGCSSFVLAVMPVGGPSKVVLRNADLILTVSHEASHGWSVEVRVLAAFLSQNDVLRAVKLSRWVAGFFGAFDAERGERCRRLDLATDWVGWVLDDSEDERLVTRPRARKTKFRATYEEANETKDTSTKVVESVAAPIDTLGVDAARVYKVARVVTGVAVAYGSPVMCRLYDKTAELEHTGAESKRALEEAMWKSGGWDGASKVVRVEYQIRGDVLDEMGLRESVDNLVDKLNGVWHYLTHDWLTLRVLGTASRLHRAALDPRWEAVQRVDWGSRSTPITRVRRRGGASLRQTLGCMLSTLGSSGALEPAVKGLSAPSMTESLQLESGAAAGGVRAWVRALSCAFALFLESGLLVEASSPQDALGELVLQVQGSVARFSVIQDDETLERAGPEVCFVNGRRQKG